MKVKLTQVIQSRFGIRNYILRYLSVPAQLNTAGERERKKINKLCTLFNHFIKAHATLGTENKKFILKKKNVQLNNLNVSEKSRKLFEEIIKSLKLENLTADYC